MNVFDDLAKWRTENPKLLSIETDTADILGNLFSVAMVTSPRLRHNRRRWSRSHSSMETWPTFRINHHLYRSHSSSRTSQRYLLHRSNRCHSNTYLQEVTFPPKLAVKTQSLSKYLEHKTYHKNMDPVHKARTGYFFRQQPSLCLDHRSHYR